MKNWDIVSILLKRQGNALTRKYVEAAHEYYSNLLLPSDIRLGLASYHMALWKLADSNLRKPCIILMLLSLLLKRMKARCMNWNKRSG